MAIHNDYILDLIQRYCEVALHALELERNSRIGEALEAYEQIVTSVLDMESTTVLDLSPASLVTMMQLSAVDESLAAWSIYALMRAADLCDTEQRALLRRQQAQALAASYELPGDLTPEELSEVLKQGPQAIDRSIR